MGWTKITREDLFEGSDSPFISITEKHFRFNTLFVRLASLDSSYRVTIFEDEQNRRLGFEFHKEKRGDSRALSSRKDGYGGLFCSNQGIVPKRSWLSAVARQSSKNRRFTPKKDGNRWCIQLCPAFEIKKARES